jgi:hypothetical protein
VCDNGRCHTEWLEGFIATQEATPARTLGRLRGVRGLRSDHDRAHLRHLQTAPTDRRGKYQRVALDIPARTPGPPMASPPHPTAIAGRSIYDNFR